MPLTDKGKKILKSMKKEYGDKKGETVFYASRNKGTIKGVDIKEEEGMAVNHTGDAIANPDRLLLKPQKRKLKEILRRTPPT